MKKKWFQECPDCEYVTPSKIGIGVHRKKVHGWDNGKQPQGGHYKKKDK